ncbi:MAG TPA: LysR family transcriptional regulator [Jiangellales bacterium]|nr:LysR family transcriptional regulator [Jiangellales bacterium]
MDLNRLRVLAAVAHEGSVTGAAAALHYSQPAISHHLGRLEAELGIPLLQRAGRGVRLTEAGRVLAERAEEILGRIRSAEAEVAAFAGLRAGRVRLAAFPSALATVVPQVANRLLAAHPELELALTECEPPEAITALRNGDVDVALVFEHDEPQSSTPDMTATALFDEPIYLVTPNSGTDRERHDAPGRPSGGRSETHASGPLARYADGRWIAGCQRCRAHLLAMCARDGFSPDIAFETDDYVATQALVAAGMGVTTLPGLALLASRNAQVDIERIPHDRRRILAFTYGRPPAPLPVQAFLKLLHTTVAAPAWPKDQPTSATSTPS